MTHNLSNFLKEIGNFIPKERIYTDVLRRFAWGTDAGFYRLTPQAVIRSDDESEVSNLLRAASEHKVAVTFRAAGTSLSGQSISDSVLIVAGKHWEKYSVAEDLKSITLEPGIVGSRVNDILRPSGRKFGPDPASIGSCMVGGIVMNNASGMSCGTHANSDRELLSARIVFADGTVLDTGDPKSRESFSETHRDFLERLSAIREEVISDNELTERIKYKYSIKNVTGLNIFPFVAFEDPFDILPHLLVGSEGTLAFLSQVTMKTLPIAPLKASAMIYFGSIREAAEAVVAMKKSVGPGIINAAELLDRRSLLSVEDPMLKEYPDADLTAVLTETTASNQEDLDTNIRRITEALDGSPILRGIGDGPVFTSDPKEYSKFWTIRSGIFPKVGGMRREGTTCLIEDVAFHIEDLPQATADLSALLDKHGYDDSCIYGHALEGNFHFIINQSFDSESEVKRYDAMIRDVVRMVVGKYDGSLKAEHGTGRNMAPFVKYEWGEKAFEVMKKVKDLFDPEGILNPGVIFNDDPECFLKDLKALGSGRCIECGFCEVNCVSCGLTLSPRTRIAVQREIMRLKALKSPASEDTTRLKALEKGYDYYGDQTCAADGLCSTSCPMGINVGDLTHQIREMNIKKSSLSYKLWAGAANRFPAAKGGIRTILRFASLGNAVLGDKKMAGLCQTLHKRLSIPLWTPSIPLAYKVPKKISEQPKNEDLKVVYFPSCLNQMMGLAPGQQSRHIVEKPLVEEMVSLLNKAGYEVVFPEKMDSLCCGMMWESKGMPDLADKKSSELESALWKASEEGRFPILCDQSPCLHRMKQKMKSINLYEPAEFILTFLKDRLEFHPSDTPVAIHLTCSTRLMGVSDKMIELARLCSTNVVVPEGVGCCGFAGDKGMTHPELNEYALRKLKAQVKDIPAGYSNSRTCEIGLSSNSGIPYVSVAYLVNSHTTAK